MEAIKVFDCHEYTKRQQKKTAFRGKNKKKVLLKFVRTIVNKGELISTSNTGKHAKMHKAVMKFHRKKAEKNIT